MIKEGKFENIIYDEENSMLIDPIINIIEDNAENIFSFFGYKPNKKLDIYIVKDKKTYDDNLKKLRNSNVPIPKWNVGTTTYDGRIYYLSFNEYPNTPHKNMTLDEYNKGMLHEFVHFVNFEYCLNNNLSIPNKVLSEGIAQYLSGQKSDKEIKFNLEKGDSYDNALYVVKYIMDNKGRDYFLHLLEHDETKDIIEDVKKHQ